MNMQNACATLFKIKIGFRFQIWFRMRPSFSYNCEWKSKAALEEIRKKQIWLPATNDQDERLQQEINAENFWKHFQLVLVVGGMLWHWFTAGVHNLPDFSSRNAKLQHPEDLQLLQIWGKCQSFHVALSSIEKNTIFSFN